MLGLGLLLLRFTKVQITIGRKNDPCKYGIFVEPWHAFWKEG